jgi:hypothetical protein
MPIHFLQQPGRSGPWGALMDEYARAANDFCGVVEGFDQQRFAAERPSTSPDAVSPRMVCVHVCASAHRYAHHIRRVMNRDFIARYEVHATRLATPGDVRGVLHEAIRFTEETVEPLRDAPEEYVDTLLLEVGASRYDPEILIEHAIVHLLRHRRQLERW